MIRRIAIVVAVALVLDGSTAFAQVFYGPVGYSSAFYHYGYQGRNFSFGGGYRYSAPVYGYSQFYFPPPVVIVVPPPTFRNREPLPANERFPTVDDFAPARVDAAVKRGDFLVVKPGAGRRAEEPPERAVKRGDFLVVKPGERAAPPPIPLPKPPVEPKALAAFLIKQAREAFEQEQIGRAGERLRAAIALQPKDSQLHFWLAQVHVARGEYPEGAAALRAGLILEPDWPAAPFDLKNLYGPRVAALAVDIADLNAIAKANPGDLGLAFVAGVYEWFSGNRRAAATLFEKAKRDYPAESQKFLDAAKR